MNEHQADEIRSQRRAKGMTQEELADAAGTSVRTIRNIEAGKSIAPATERAVYKALGLAKETEWPEAVAAFLEMLGFRLTSLEPERRRAVIHALTDVAINDDHPLVREQLEK